MEQSVMNTLQQYPSIMAGHESERMSNKYKFIPTIEVVKTLDDAGWQVSRVQEKRSKGELLGFQKHMIRFRRKSDFDAKHVGEHIPEVVLTNSHDGSSSFVFNMGIFRLICSNGAVVADAMFGSIRVKHIGYQPNKVLHAVHEIADGAPALLDHIKDFKAIPLTRAEQYAFAESALNMRMRSDEGHRADVVGTPAYMVGERLFDLNALIAPVRSGDRDPSLWNTYNVIQEKFTKGGRFELGDEYLTRYGSRKVRNTEKVRAIKSIDEDLRINKELWGLTEKMAELKA